MAAKNKQTQKNTKTTKNPQIISEQQTEYNHYSHNVSLYCNLMQML